MSPRLLIIDDEPNLRYSLEQSLRSETLEVVTAANASQGIDQVRRQPPDAVLLDVRLPDMSGLDAFDRIRQLDPRLPVIIMTAYSSTDTAIEAMKRGAFEYLLKPVDFRSLRASWPRRSSSAVCGTCRPSFPTKARPTTNASIASWAIRSP